MCLCALRVSRRGVVWCFFFFQAEDGIRDLVRSRGLGDVYKRQGRRYRSIAQARRKRACLEAVRRTLLSFRLPNRQELSLIHI